jgi:hypothetical protein
MLIFQEPELFPTDAWTLLCTLSLDSPPTPVHFADLSLVMVPGEATVHLEVNDCAGIEHEIDVSPPEANIPSS